MLVTYDKDTDCFHITVRRMQNPVLTGSGKQFNIVPDARGITAGDGPLSDPVCDPISGEPIKWTVTGTVRNPDYVKTADESLSQRDKSTLREAINGAASQNATAAGMVQLPQPINLADGTTLPAGALLPAHLVAKLLTGGMK